MINIMEVKLFEGIESDPSVDTVMKGAKVIFQDTHVSGHACEEEIKLIYSLVKPKYAVPVHYGEVGSDENASNFVSQLDSDIKGIILK